MSSTGSIVKLNIGGTVFQTTRSTLTKFNGMFKAMMETDIPVIKDDSGAIFFDRPSKHFELILNYMRGLKVHLPEPLREVKELYAEARYYQLTGLIQLCNPVLYKDNLSKLFALKDDDIVKINVGGTLFEAKKSRWLNRSGKINDMLSGREPVAFDESGNIFINRSPKNFKRISSIITEGKQLIFSNQEQDELLEEAKFYKIDRHHLIFMRL